MSLAKPAPLLPPPAPAPQQPVEEKETIEKDTESGFEDITVQLLPEGKFPSALDLFSISVRNAAMRGWVKQPSPCCAASSIAGCFNTVRGLERTDKLNGAVDAKDVIAIMDGQLDEDRQAKHASCARILGLKDTAVLSYLERRVGEIQDAKGRPLTSRKKDALKPPDLRLAIREATVRAIAGGFEGVEESEMELWKALDGMYAAADAAKAAANAPATSEAAVADEASGGGRVPLGATDGNPNPGAAGDEGDEGEELLSFTCGGTEQSGPVAHQREVHKALVSALQVHIGQLKLRAEHPSTAFFGNGDVLKAVRKMGESLGVSVSGRNFIGKGLKGKNCINLDAADTADVQEAQWRALVSELARSDTALLMHMTNHYCMIYATREWAERPAPVAGGAGSTSTELRGGLAEARDGAPKPVRQVLSSKPGQRPSRWLDWHDLRKQMLGWAGYKVLAVKLEA